jgi:hypothetical protein
MKVYRLPRRANSFRDRIGRSSPEPNEQAIAASIGSGSMDPIQQSQLTNLRGRRGTDHKRRRALGRDAVRRVARLRSFPSAIDRVEKHSDEVQSSTRSIRPRVRRELVGILQMRRPVPAVPCAR